MKYHIQWLIEKLEAGERFEYVFFWGHQPRKDGSSVGDSCFSQWWQSPFEVDGITYATAEHWMMAQKARRFNDDEVLAQILQSTSPADAKDLGRAVRNFDLQSWNDHKYQYVKTGNWHKFTQHEDLKAHLLSTGDRILVEASPLDRIWGIGLAQSNPDAGNPTKWKGENLLGFALMEVRDELTVVVNP